MALCPTTALPNILSRNANAYKTRNRTTGTLTTVEAFLFLSVLRLYFSSSSRTR